MDGVGTSAVFGVETDLSAREIAEKLVMCRSVVFERTVGESARLL